MNDPKCGVVLLSTLVKEDRWDPPYYLGYIAECKAKVRMRREGIARARGAVRRAKRLLAGAEHELDEERQRVQANVASGKINVLKEDES